MGDKFEKERSKYMQKRQKFDRFLVPVGLGATPKMLSYIFRNAARSLLFVVLSI